MADIDLSVGISGIVGGLLTPLIIHYWSRLSPPAETSEFDSMGMSELRARNNWIDNVCTVLSLLGLLSVLPFYLGPVEWESGWPVGLGLGMMVIFPVTFSWLATRSGGIRRWYEFWRFYELKWGIGLRGLRWFYVPLALLGALSLVMILFGR